MNKITEIKQGLITYSIERNSGNYFIHDYSNEWDKIEITKKEYNDILNEVRAIREVLLNK